MTTGTHQTTDDPMAAAMNATKEPRDRTYFGEVITVDSWFCVLQKGVGKRPWDSTHDDVKDRRIVIKLEIQPLKGEYTISQEALSFESTWLEHTMLSLQKLQVDLHTLRGKFASVKRVPTGENYKNKAGDIKERTALEFVAIYDTLDACQAAADAFFQARTSGSGNGRGVQEETLPDLPGSMPPEQEFALKSLPALWKASGHDKQKFVELIQQNPLISKYYPPDHRIVIALMDGDDDPLPF
jgi:hypothetical protein